MWEDVNVYDYLHRHREAIVENVVKNTIPITSELARVMLLRGPKIVLVWLSNRACTHRTETLLSNIMRYTMALLSRT